MPRTIGYPIASKHAFDRCLEVSFMRFGATPLIGLGLRCSSLPLMAHHSFAAEYDSKKTITVHGIVQKVAWAVIFSGATGASGLTGL